MRTLLLQEAIFPAGMGDRRAQVIAFANVIPSDLARLLTAPVAG